MKTLTMMTLLSLSSAALAVEPQQVDLYLKATRGEAGAAANAYASFNQSLAVDAADPLTLLYAGSARTLMAREAREPTTAGRYTQEGVALIRQALAASGAEQLERQHQGMREGDYINAIAAATLTSLPEFFGTRSQGLALFEALLADPEFLATPAVARDWLLPFALAAAQQQGRSELAEQWSNMVVAGSNG